MRLSAAMAAGVLAALLAGCASFAPGDRPLHSFSGAHELGATALAFSPDGARLASAGLRGDIALWQVQPPRPWPRCGGIPRRYAPSPGRGRSGC